MIRKVVQVRDCILVTLGNSQRMIMSLNESLGSPIISIPVRVESYDGSLSMSSNDIKTHCVKSKGYQ